METANNGEKPMNHNNHNGASMMTYELLKECQILEESESNRKEDDDIEDDIKMVDTSTTCRDDDDGLSFEASSRSFNKEASERFQVLQECQILEEDGDDDLNADDVVKLKEKMLRQQDDDEVKREKDQRSDVGSPSRNSNQRRLSFFTDDMKIKKNSNQRRLSFFTDDMKIKKKEIALASPSLAAGAVAVAGGGKDLKSGKIRPQNVTTTAGSTMHPKMKVARASFTSDPNLKTLRSSLNNNPNAAAMSSELNELDLRLGGGLELRGSLRVGAWRESQGGSSRANSDFTSQDFQTRSIQFEMGSSASNHFRSSLNLPFAQPIGENDAPILPFAEMQVAEEGDLMDKSDKEQAEKKRTRKMMLMLLLLVIVVVTVLATTLTKGNTDKKTSESDTTNGTTASINDDLLQQEEGEEEVPIGEYILSLLPEATQELILRGEEGNPQQLAYDWLVQDVVMAVDHNDDDHDHDHDEDNDSNTSTNTTTSRNWNYDTATDPDLRMIQRYALATLFYSTDGETSWFQNEHWLDHNVHECDWWTQDSNGFWEDWGHNRGRLWYNVTNTTGVVEGERERYNCHPDNDAMEHLWIKNNKLRGTIPPQIFLLTSLKSLSLERNELDSTIPNEIGKLTNLEALGIYNTDVRGSIPTQVALATGLQYLWLFSNYLTGQIPSQFGLLSDTLTHLTIDTNELQGSLPTQLGTLSNLIYFYLWKNNVGGTLPSQLGNWAAMETFAIDFNDMTGTIPSQLGLLTKAETLHINDMLLTGTFPSQLGGLKVVWSLSYGRQLITGTLPTQIGRLSDMWLLQGSANLQTGTLPTEIGTWQSWPWSWDFSHNFFTGQIPSEMGMQGDGTYLMKLNNNRFSGSIPSELGLLKDLEVLYLDNNLLSGTIPYQLRNMDFPPYVWDESSNSTVPTSHLKELFLDNNRLSGSIPAWLGTFPGLKALTLQNNHDLSGTIPSILCDLESWQTSRTHDWWELEAYHARYAPLLGTVVENGFFPFTGIVVDCQSVECGCGEEVCHCAGDENATLPWDFVPIRSSLDP